MIDLQLQKFGGGGSGSGLAYDGRGFSQKITSSGNIGGKGTYILFDPKGKPYTKMTGEKLKEKINNGDIAFDKELEEWVTKKDAAYTIRKYDKTKAGQEKKEKENKEKKKKGKKKKK